MLLLLRDCQTNENPQPIRTGGMNKDQQANRTTPRRRVVFHVE